VGAAAGTQGRAVMSITVEQQAALRAPFPAEEIGKLPRLFCHACRESQRKVCQEHRWEKCTECGQKHSTGSFHLDYVGHAETTDRLLSVDPSWTWEPMGTDERGMPIFDALGGLWLRLTVCGHSRIGYGFADGKKGGDAIKEAIGDGIRNAAMRFGVALDLWRKTDRVERQAGASQETEPAAPTRRDLLRRQVMDAAAAVELGSVVAVRDDYTAWSQGAAISEADDDTLARYRDSLIVRREKAPA
jgi:hypothetical protein